MQPLAGARVGILQTRHAGEFAALIERSAGVPVLAPCLREVRPEDERPLREAVEAVAGQAVDFFIFQTGVGTAALLESAAKFGLAGPLEGRIRSAVVVARGPKPLSVLLRAGFRVDRRTAAPHTTEQVIEVLPGDELGGRRVALQHFGRPNERLVKHLRASGAEIIELAAYRWALPEDVAPVHELLRQLDEGRLRVVAFTSAAQVENLFEIAEATAWGRRLSGMLNERTVVAAVGPTTSAALAEHGVQVRIQPQVPKMVPLVKAITERFS